MQTFPNFRKKLSVCYGPPGAGYDEVVAMVVLFKNVLGVVGGDDCFLRF
jgi:hypothetical protein